MQELDKNELKAQTFEPPLFYLNDVFSLIEASCLLSGDIPTQINRCFNDTNFDQNYPFFVEAYSFINSAIWAGSLPENLIPSHQLKIYLQSKGKIIEGFNDNLPTQEPIGCVQPSIQQIEPTIENLNAELARLRNVVMDKAKTIEELQERIKQIDAKKQEIHSEESTISKELTGIEKLNQSAKDRQGMARVIATKLWQDDQAILIGVMADKVYREMINYCVDELPDNTDTLKNWIRSVAPEEAKKRGRPPKKSIT